MAKISQKAINAAKSLNAYPSLLPFTLSSKKNKKTTNKFQKNNK